MKVHPSLGTGKLIGLLFDGSGDEQDASVQVGNNSNYTQFISLNSLFHIGTPYLKLFCVLCCSVLYTHIIAKLKSNLSDRRFLFMIQKFFLTVMKEHLRELHYAQRSCPGGGGSTLHEAAFPHDHEQIKGNPVVRHTYYGVTDS